MIQITLSEESRARIDEIAKRAKLTRSAAIERAILTMPLPRMIRKVPT
ncbi:MAG TPA: ribbon-helix-helix protein, CopG family [Polyangiaceae bacterium]|nr:ribbon-helix-helix protein, CopG family [Polyangiaceae bacterium]